MDIFEIAQQGMQIQEDEIKEQEAAEKEALDKKKQHKFNVKEAIEAVSNKDYNWFHELGLDGQKNFQPFMLNLWLGMIWTENRGRAFSGNDEFYASIVRKVNSELNANIFLSSKEMLWLLACTTQDYINFDYDKKGNKIITGKLPFTYDWVKSLVKNADEKYNKKVINYIASELYSSNDKIIDMIDNNLITAEDMKAIEQDLATLEDQRKKKK